MIVKAPVENASPKKVQNGFERLVNTEVFLRWPERSEGVIISHQLSFLQQSANTASVAPPDVN